MAKIQTSHSGEFKDRGCCVLPPVFPSDVFSPTVRDVIAETAKAYAVPFEVPATAVLVLAGACIGRTRGICIKAGWVEFPNLFVALVGVSGTGKSPATDFIFRPVHAKEFEWHQEYLNAQEEEDNSANRQQLLVDDSTVEALSEALSANPRGILWHRDELSGLLLSLDRYGGKSGSTKTRLMSSYNSGPWKVTRIGERRNHYIRHATLGIFGTIIPQALPRIFSGYDTATGFLSRFLILRVPGDSPPSWTDETVTQKGALIWEWIIEELLHFQFHMNQPNIIGVCPDAKRAYTLWYDGLKDNRWTDSQSHHYYNSVIAKLRAQCLRIALILHCISNVGTKESELAPVTAETMHSAIRLSNFLLEQQRRIYALINSAQDVILSPVQISVARAIVTLEGSIENGFLSTDSISKAVNNGVDAKFRMNARAIGKIATSLDLSRHRLGAGKRGCRITPDDMTSLKNMLQGCHLSHQEAKIKSWVTI
jgi:hypothetical protein